MVFTTDLYLCHIGLYFLFLYICSGPQVEVWFMDYGNKDTVPIRDIWYLSTDHVTLPAQALPLAVTCFLEIFVCLN